MTSHRIHRDRWYVKVLNIKWDRIEFEDSFVLEKVMVDGVVSFVAENQKKKFFFAHCGLQKEASQRIWATPDTYYQLSLESIEVFRTINQRKGTTNGLPIESKLCRKFAYHSGRQIFDSRRNTAPRDSHVLQMFFRTSALRPNIHKRIEPGKKRKKWRKYVSYIIIHIDNGVWPLRNYHITQFSSVCIIITNILSAGYF